MHFVPISGACERSRSSFVDDTSVGFTSTLGDTQYSDLILQLQEVTQLGIAFSFFRAANLTSACAPDMFSVENGNRAVLLYGRFNQTIPRSC